MEKVEELFDALNEAWSRCVSIRVAISSDDFIVCSFTTIVFSVIEVDNNIEVEGYDGYLMIPLDSKVDFYDDSWHVNLGDLDIEINL